MTGMQAASIKKQMASLPLITILACACADGRLHEGQGVPIRLELGPKDMEKRSCVLARRDTGKKEFVDWDSLTSTTSALLEDIQVTLS